MFRFFKRQPSVTKIAFDPPRPQTGRAGLALVLIVKNEQRHIAEWARFHLLAGVAHIFAYDNGCTDGTIAALRSEAGDRLTVVPWAQKLRDPVRGLELHNQVLAYAHAAQNFGGAYRWISFIDADEFLIPKATPNLPAALAPLESTVRNISLPWHMFGRSGHQEAPAGGVLTNYLLRNPNPMSDEKGLRNFKMIVDPCHVTALKVHEIETDGSTMTCNDEGRAFTLRGRSGAEFYAATRIQLNHYYTRSNAELQAKITRGPNLTTRESDHIRRVMRKVDAIERDQIEDRTAVEYLARLGADWSA